MTKTLLKLERVDIKITQESDMGALLLGFQHPFKCGDILSAIIITKRYCKEHLNFREGFFIVGHGFIPDIYYTTKITKKEYEEYLLKVNNRLSTIISQKREIESNEIELKKIIKYIMSKRVMRDIE